MFRVKQKVKKVLRALSPAAELSPAQLAMPWQHSARVMDLMNTAGKYSLYAQQSLAMILALGVMARDIEGDYVECGVARGGTAAMLAATLQARPEKRLWLYDTYEGMPAPTEEDGDEAKPYVGVAKGTEETVREALSTVHFDLNRAKLIKGLFQDTFHDVLPEKIALLHIDADWYESVWICLETLVPRVAEGGIIILDDFGHWEGTRRAFYKYCAQYGVEPLVERYGHTQMFWRKGQENTRDTVQNYYPHGSLSASFPALFERL